VLYQRKREAAGLNLTVALMQSIPSFLWSLLLIAGLRRALAGAAIQRTGPVRRSRSPGLTGFALCRSAAHGAVSGAWSAWPLTSCCPHLRSRSAFAPLVIRVLRSSLIRSPPGEPYVRGRGGCAACPRAASSGAICSKNAALSHHHHDRRAVRFLFGAALAGGNDLRFIPGSAISWCRP